MESTRKNLIVGMLVFVFCSLAVGTAGAQARSASPNRPVIACRVVHEGALQFCLAVEHRKAIRTIRTMERREAVRAAVSLRIGRHPLSWNVTKLRRANHWERHRLAHLRTLPSSYCLGQTGTRLIGCQILQARGGTASDWSDLEWMWSKESGWQSWDPNSSGCNWIPQACPESKIPRDRGPKLPPSIPMQVKWGLGYIDGRYGSIANAAAFWRSHSWY